jgi:hypothetical protein
MISLSVAARIWVKTVAMNAFLWGVWSVLRGNIWEAFGSILVLLGGIIVTLPLLMFIVPLVNVSALLPYSIPAKIGWLTFYLIVMIVLFYGLFSHVESNIFFNTNSWAGKLMGSTIGGLLIAVLTTRKSLNKLYKKS